MSCPTAEKKVRLLRSNGEAAHTVALQLPFGPCARPQCVDDDKNRPINPEESGTACAQYTQTLNYEEWPDKKFVALIDYGSPHIPVKKLRLYIDDKCVETEEHIDVKNTTLYRCTKFCIWVLIILIGLAIVIIVEQSTKGTLVEGPALVVLIVVCVIIACWLWNCCFCGKCGKATVDVNVDDFKGYTKKENQDQQKKSNNSGNQRNQQNDYDNDREDS